MRHFGDGIFYLFTILISVTIVFEGSFPNFNVARKSGNAHHSSPMDIVGKEEMRMER